ncbi:MAG: hypothetical protein AB7F89_06115 [Pirellulaceae bacterium]
MSQHMSRPGTVCGRLACGPAIPSVLAALMLVSSATLVFGEEDSAVAIRLDRQQQAQARAAELVAHVFDVQLRQLRENRLERSPFYAEVAAMRENVQEIVAQEMPSVTRLLEATQQPGGSPAEALSAARGKIRDIVAALMSERRKVQTRLQLARVDAQTRQLIELQSRVRERTAKLVELEFALRERSTLGVLEDQRDAKGLYSQLLVTLEQAARWGGAQGQAAARGRELLKDSQVDAQLDASERELIATRFEQAGAAQQQTLDVLQNLLQILQEADGTRNRDPRFARQANELADRQRQVREQTAAADLTDGQVSERLAGQEAEIASALENLLAEVASLEDLPELVGRAQTAARDAELQLFEGNREEALARQEEVIAALREAAQQSQAGSDAPPGSSLTPAEAARLKQLERQLADARPLQEQVARDAKSEVDRARATQQEVARQIDQAAKEPQANPAVQEQLERARESVAQSQETLEQSTDAQQRSEAANEALRAIEKAMSEVQSALKSASSEATQADAEASATASSEAGTSQEGAPSGSKLADADASKSPAGQTSAADTGDGSGAADDASEQQRARLSSAVRNQDTKFGAATGANDNVPSARRYERDPWFLQLPPALQEAVRGGARRPPPRGYEERLRRYFEAM